MERRAERRFDVDTDMCVVPVEQEQVCFSGRVVNVSSTGMRIVVDGELEPGGLASIQVGEELFMVEIQYAEYDGECYYAGLRLLDWTDRTQLDRTAKQRAGLT